MSLFSPIERETAKEYLVSLAKENKEIIAGILLGSASYGYIDELSDIDFCVVVNQEENIEKVMSYMQKAVQAYNAVYCFEQLTQRRLQVYLFDNYLEINISFQSENEIYIKKCNWKVVLDKSGTIEMKIKESWAAYQEAQIKKAKANDVHEKVKCYATEIWHFLFHCAIAIKRGRCWRAIGEIDIVRNRLIELKGLRYSIATGRHREVDMLPKDELKIIQMTMVSDISRETLERCLNLLVDEIYDELDIQGGKDFYTLTRQQVKEYTQKVLI